MAELAPAPPGPVEARFATLTADLRAHDPGTRLGADPEELHQFRVATRRLRALLRGVRDLVDADWEAELRGELRELGGVVGHVRDLDVLIERLQDEIAALDPPDREAAAPLLLLLHGDREAARADLLATLDGDRYRALLDLLGRGVVAERPPTPAELDAVVERELRRTRRAAERAGAGATDAELHALRIRVKRARYAAELVGRGRIVERAKRLQDVLGDHQDAVVAEERIRELADRAGGGATGVACGLLIAGERRRQRNARRSWRQAWRDLDRAHE